jgi:hypothetical protein
MPVILRNEAESEGWLTTPADVALVLQRPLPDDELMIVATGERKDEAVTPSPVLAPTIRRWLRSHLSSYTAYERTDFRELAGASHVSNPLHKRPAASGRHLGSAQRCPIHRSGREGGYP